MKKILTLALMLTIVATTAFSHTTGVVNKKVVETFSKEFANAESVKWEVTNEVYKATFRIDGQTMFAYYNEAGEQLAVARNLMVSQLPITLAADLQDSYKKYPLTELFEVAADNETAYYATVHSATHEIILKSTGASGWSVYKKEKK